MSAMTQLLKAQKEQNTGLKKHEQYRMKEQMALLQKQEEDEARRQAFEAERRQQVDILKAISRTGEVNHTTSTGGLPLSKWMTHAGPGDMLSYRGHASKASDANLVTRSAYSHTVNQVQVNNGRGPAAVNRDETANRHPQRRAYSHKKTNSPFNVIISCVKSNNLEKLERKVDEFISSGGGINSKENDNPFGWSPLHYAAHLGNASILKYLVTVRGININITDGNGMTPLMCAVIENRKDCVEVLIKCPGIQIDQSSLEKPSALSKLGNSSHASSSDGSSDSPGRSPHLQPQYPHLGSGPGPSALVMAEHHGYHDIVALLKSALSGGSGNSNIYGGDMSTVGAYSSINSVSES